MLIYLYGIKVGENKCTEVSIKKNGPFTVLNNVKWGVTHLTGKIMSINIA